MLANSKKKLTTIIIFVYLSNSEFSTKYVIGGMCQIMLGKYIKHFTDILGNKSKLKLHNHLSFVEIDKELPIMWLFPYFMESLIKAVLPSLTMLDYKVTANSVSPRISPRGVLIFGLKMTLSLFPFETKMRHKNKKKT